ncbi:hypothetical protein [Oceanobacillus halotolerans]|uniref:hypothetical protein n=1 Tax=Oceanobacillus halotolerans TaxID=2663380 RepID=UPI001CF7EACA|nr:hypothetical protein [Oceanobacillus halotolerans]
MEGQRVDKLNSTLEEIKSTVGEQDSKKMELDKCKRIIQKLSSFSTDCEECYRHFIDLEAHIEHLMDKKDSLVEDDFKHHKQKIGDIRSHLQKQHKLVPSGYYMSIYMSLGISLGVVLGLLIFDNIGLGLPFGISIGLAIGVGVDEDAKKKGLTL